MKKLFKITIVIFLSCCKDFNIVNVLKNDKKINKIIVAIQNLNKENTKIENNLKNLQKLVESYIKKDFL